MSKPSITPADQRERDEALNFRASYIVQAPAGSGKTELLTHRFLKLLAHVDEPEEVLAITFTRAATAEMRARILRKLEDARDNPKRQNSDDAMLLSARAALAHAEARGWKLLKQPQRLNIQTIDSLCMSIAHEQPLLARMGGHLQPQEDARPLYQEAARRTLAHLGGRNRELHASLLRLLQLRDNNLGDVQRLIAGMLANRDQWVHVFPLVGDIAEDQWTEIRLLLERPFRMAINRALRTAYDLLPAKETITEELVALANYASGNLSEIDLRAVSHLRNFPEPNDKFLEQWLCFCNLLLTANGESWRKQVTVREGFPAAKSRIKDAPEQRYKDRMMDVIRHLSKVDGLLAALCDLRRLPTARYDEDQWQMLRGLITVLRFAIAELRVLFAQENAVDFVELGLSALTVLEEQQPTERSLAVSERVKHLLVDEFQDTSRRQHKLLERLLHAWGPGEERTYFLVGDPMQSIYMFRQAEVELFAQVQERGIVSASQVHSCIPLHLSANFRSHAGLTEPLNAYFETIFNHSNGAGSAAVSFSRSIAIESAFPEPSVCLHPQILQGTGNGKADPDAVEQARERETEAMLSIIEKHRPVIAAAEADPKLSYTIAVLGRAKEHLAGIAAKLRERGIPFRAVELEQLGERQEIRDLLSLIRALLHPMDRIAWLSALRAPWCGLMLEDLHILSGSDEKHLRSVPIRQLIKERMPLLSADGQLRLRRIFAILARALDTRYSQSQSLSLWIERTWHTLGGPLCLDGQQQENVRIFFRMLDEVAPDGIDCLGEKFDERLGGLFAQPDPRASERYGVQLMTIHKAKGLGFDVVLVPGLERSTGQDSKQLIAMLERVSLDRPGEDEILVAPIGSRGEDNHPLYQWVRKQRRIRENEERKRVFYVACTRARRELHLFGTATTAANGDIKPGAPDSLLAAAWPALADDFIAAHREQPQPSVIPFPAATPQPGITSLAAAADHAHPAFILRRIAADATFQPAGENVTTPITHAQMIEERERFERPEGSRLQRTIGSVIHALLEQLSKALLQKPDVSPEDISRLAKPQASAMLRAAALPAEQAEQALAEILSAITATATDPIGRWLLSAHPEAQSEASWTGWLDGKLRTIRADRIFRGGSAPFEKGSDYFWIVDYKTTAYTGKDISSFLTSQRQTYESQLAAYGRALRKLHDENLTLRMGLYFPRMQRLEYWTG